MYLGKLHAEVLPSMRSVLDEEKFDEERHKMAPRQPFCGATRRISTRRARDEERAYEACCFVGNHPVRGAKTTIFMSAMVEIVSRSFDVSTALYIRKYIKVS